MKSILIIEDDYNIRKMMECTIHSNIEDVKTLTTESGKEALQIAKRMSIDVFIVDIMLPDYNGIELAKVIRKSYPYNPIIIESSKGDGTYQSMVLKQIKNLAFFKKPFSNNDFIVTIRYAMNLAEKLNARKLILKKSGRIRVLTLEDILYIEKVKNDKKVRIFFYDTKLNASAMEEFYGYTLATLLEMSEKELLQCHKSYLINPKMIEKINYGRDTLTLRYTGEEIPVGEKFKHKIDLFLGGY